MKLDHEVYTIANEIEITIKNNKKKYRLLCNKTSMTAKLKNRQSDNINTALTLVCPVIIVPLSLQDIFNQ